MTVTDNKGCTATLKVDIVNRTYTINATVTGGGGTINPSGAVVVVCGQDQTFTFTPDGCHTVGTVTVDGLAQPGHPASYTFTNVQANHTIDVTFDIKTYTLTTNVSGSGTVSASPPGPTYNCGTSVLLTASATAGNHLDHWSTGDPGTTNPLKVTVTADAKITAFFLPNVYTWLPTGTSPWTTPANWSPTRYGVSTSDVLLFNNGATTTATNLPSTESIAQVLFSNSTKATWLSFNGTVLSLSGGSLGLDIPAGSSLTLNGTAAVQINLGSLATCSVAGTLNVSKGAHRLRSAAAPGSFATAFQNGSLVKQSTGFSGNLFGAGANTPADPSNLNTVEFKTGALFAHSAGSNPFGAAQPNSVIKFDTHSRYRVDSAPGFVNPADSTTITPAMSGRTYADFEWNTTLVPPFPIVGGGTLSIDDLIVTKGAMRIGMTGTYHQRGDITVQAAGTLDVDPASGAPVVSLDGSAQQHLTINGTLTTLVTSGTVQAGFDIKNPLDVQLLTNVTWPGYFVFTNGKLQTNGKIMALTAPGNTTGASQSTGWVVVGPGAAGVLQRNVPNATDKVYDIGDATTYTPITVRFAGLAQPFDLQANVHTPDHPNIATSGINPAKSVNRYWNLTPGVGGSPSFTSYSATMDYVAADVDPGANPSTFVVRRYNGAWFAKGSNPISATETQGTGLTGYGDLAIGERAQHTVTATADPGGTINPSGNVTVLHGDDITFTFTPDGCHSVGTVTVDGFPVPGHPSSYTIHSVTADHTIHVSWILQTRTITATAGPGGSINPSGTVTVDCDGSQKFDVTADPGYYISQILVGGNPITVPPNATSQSVVVDHVTSNTTIHADFARTQYEVHVVFPNSAPTILLVGSKYPLSWTVSDPQAVLDHLDLYISRDNGAHWEKIASGLTPSTTTFSWVVTGPGNNTGATVVYSSLFRVTGVSVAAKEISDVSDNAFAIYDLVTSTLVSQFQAAPVEAGVELRWQLGDAGLFTGVVLERAEEEAGPWAAVEAERRVEGAVTILVDKSAVVGSTYYYRLQGQVAGGGEVTLGQVSGQSGERITEFALSKIAPNPTPGRTRIDWAVAKEAGIRLSILDVQGREVAVLADGVMTPGRYSVTWSGETDRGKAPAGIYFVRYHVQGAKNIVKRLVLAR